MFHILKSIFRTFISIHLRPPGALEEKRFIGACIKCARCMEVCPYESILPAPYSSGLHYGTPVINPAKMPCYLCMKCPEVCPTGALRVIRKEETNMGLACIVKETCLSYLGTVCNLCYKLCPLKSRAITLDGELRPVIIRDGCTGCGVCLYVCPTEPKSIRITTERDLGG